MEPQIEERDGRRFAKVRVPVVVDSDGCWVAHSDHTKTRKVALSEVVGTAYGLHFDSSMRAYFLYALVPVPAPDPAEIVDTEVRPQ